MELDAETELERRASIRRPSNFASIRNMFERAQFEKPPMLTRMVNWFYGISGVANEQNNITEEVIQTKQICPTSTPLSSKIVKSKVKFFEAMANNITIDNEAEDDKGISLKERGYFDIIH